MIEKQNKEFRRVEGVAEKAWPFSIKAKAKNDVLAILVHGFSGSPYDMWILADFLAGNGIDVEVPLLAGHGGTMETFAKTKNGDWAKSVEGVLAESLEKYRKVFIVGYSFGANLGLHLSIKYPQLAGAVSLGIPIFMRHEARIRFLLPLA